MSAAWIYAGLCGVVIGFQLALVAGAPWGHLTQGGRFSGRLPAGGRALAAVSVPVLAGMALGVLSAAGAWPGWPRWTGWGALGATGLTMAANLATPSAPERRLWGPVTVVMVLCAVWVMVGSDGGG